jgi:transcriptional regulator with XRE-family HTH domain
MTLEIANKLIELRKARGVSQEELAAHLGISRQAISKWERGEASPDIDNIIMLSRFYGVSIDELLCRGAEYETAVEESAPYEEPSGEFPYEEEPAEPAAELKAMPVPEEGARFASVREIECSARASVTMFGAEGDEVSGIATVADLTVKSARSDGHVKFGDASSIAISKALPGQNTANDAAKGTSPTLAIPAAMPSILASAMPALVCLSGKFLANSLVPTLPQRSASSATTLSYFFASSARPAP